jgi:hypothetical protein
MRSKKPGTITASLHISLTLLYPTVLWQSDSRTVLHNLSGILNSDYWSRSLCHPHSSHSDCMRAEWWHLQACLRDNWTEHIRLLGLHLKPSSPSPSFEESAFFTLRAWNYAFNGCHFLMLCGITYRLLFTCYLCVRILYFLFCTFI